MIFYCPHCWKELSDGQASCPFCHESISSWDEKTFTDKLVHALFHPEPVTQTRAVYLLGERKSKESLRPLTRLFQQSKNVFLQSEIIAAAGKIGGDDAFVLVLQALRHRSFIVIGEAAKTLRRFRGYPAVRKELRIAFEDASDYVREKAHETLEDFRSAGAN